MIVPGCTGYAQVNTLHKIIQSGYGVISVVGVCVRGGRIINPSFGFEKDRYRLSV